MPATTNNKDIRKFFKAFTIPKERIPVNDVIEEEIVVASPKRTIPGGILRPQQPTDAPTDQRDARKSSESSTNASSPTRNRRLTLKKLETNSHANEATDDVLLHHSSPSSQRRVMTAVEIPSPNPLQPLQKDELPLSSTSISFSSISTLSSVPMSTQSSRRTVTRDGMQAVTNSDSGSAGSDSDELADPSTFIVRKRRKLTPPGQDVDHATEIPSTFRPARQSTRLSEQSKRSSTTSGASTPRLASSPPRTVYKHSLMNLVKQHKKREKTEARIEQAESAFEEVQRKQQLQREQEGELDSGLRVAVEGDSDEGERMMLAMERTEALQDEERFYYFRKIRPASMPKTCPATGTRWGRLLASDQSWTQACLSGFLAELAANEDFDEEILLWMADQLVRETREDMCEAYVETLRRGALRPQSRRPISWDLTSVYETFDLSAIHSNVEDRQRRGRMPVLDGRPPGLRYALQVERYLRAADFKNAEGIAASLGNLILAGIDEYVRRDSALQSTIHECIEHVLDAVADESLGVVLEDVHQKVFEQDTLSLQLQCRAIAALPALSKRSHRLRRSLALHLIAGNVREFDYMGDPDLPDWSDEILNRLKKDRRFAISEATNYAELNALISVLDIAIDAGFSDHVFPTVSNPPPKPTGPLATKPSPHPTAEATFNAQIDTLTYHLRQMSSRIRDAGTSHLRRTETKSAIERLVVRLEHSVRTRPKPRKGIFGGVTGEQRSFLSGFLKQMVPNAEDRGSDDVTVVPLEILSGREGSDASAVADAEDVDV